MKPPINIVSNTKGIGGALTNPTTISFHKGNITRHYPVYFEGRTYPDSEAAYKANITVRGPTTSNMNLMIRIISAKLLQHPILIQGIKRNGGCEWILSCSHTGYGGSWEGIGKNSAFILCLAKAYENISNPTVTGFSHD